MSASARLTHLTFADRSSTEESSELKRPSTNTSFVHSTHAKGEASSFAAISGSDSAVTGAGRNGVLAIAATLVYFHSSLLVVGNPSSAKLRMAALRIGFSHPGSFPASLCSSSEYAERYVSCCSLTAII